MQCDKLKKQVSLAALDYVPNNSMIGFGSGSTILYFIKALYKTKKKIFGAVSSSYYTTLMLHKYGIQVFELSTVSHPIIYVDSADEINDNLEMIKGGGGALTNEKIIAATSEKFICIIHESKLVKQLGRFPLPIEIIPMAYTYVLKKIIQLGGKPKYREGYVTDHGNIIIDVYDLNLGNPSEIENLINSIPGVVTVGLFSINTPDIVLIGTKSGIKILK
ncbi:Ribose-5-phosphate isomerase A [Buchnera aphidicola (Takecallis arundicolens)]|uniref:ribose-5-phosphate isomerase RpiA n=1 Tax=Buchnera aphidicola TaxID=9 RepID=UPI003463B9CC